MTNILIVGAGLSGATIANLIATDYPNIKIKIIDKREHIGGNIYDYIDEETGIRVSKYGAHLWHTNDDEVWNYIQKFGRWVRWEHKVIAKIDENTYVPIPVNPTTINTLENISISNEKEMDEWLKDNTIQYKEPFKNSEEVSLQRVGAILYEKLFKQYTIKQWNREPKDLDPSVMSRIPIQKTFDNRYFQDKYQALPYDGYTSIVQKMLDLSNIEICLNTEWNDNMKFGYNHIIFTGPIDVYFPDLPKLEYRSIEFTKEVYECIGYIQPNSVVNYPSIDIPYTRTVEYKHFLHQKSSKSIVFHEKTSDIGEPYYPVPNQRNMDLYKKYQNLSYKEENVHFLGRLANYKYFNMDQAVRNSLDYYKNVFKNKIL
jgi:UDP-galactopyranose mutase